jgi:hypothetical protein
MVGECNANKCYGLNRFFLKVHWIICGMPTALDDLQLVRMRKISTFDRSPLRLRRWQGTFVTLLLKLARFRALNEGDCFR